MGPKVHPEKDRLDRVLVAQGLAPSRDAAVRMILAGEVRIGGMVADKPSRLTPSDAAIEIHHQGGTFVGRGGEKLAAALEAGSIDVRGAVCLDIGCSTGGFTDCLLQRGAARVYAVDVGYGQLAWSLRQDARVVLHERTNARYLDRTIVPEAVDLAVVDVSFISLTMILPPIIPLLRPGGGVIALVKPQFEVGKGQVGRGGIVRDEAQRQQVVQRIVNFAAGLGLHATGLVNSPIAGKKGNREILSIFRFSVPDCDKKGAQQCSALS